MTQGDFLLFILLMRKGMEGREEGKRERRKEGGKWWVMEDFLSLLFPLVLSTLEEQMRPRRRSHSSKAMWMEHCVLLLAGRADSMSLSMLWGS